MQVVQAVVGGQHIVLSVQGELPSGNPIGEAAGDASKERVTLKIAGQGIKPQNHIPQLAMAVPRVELRHQNAVVGELQRGAVGIAKDESVGFAAIWQRAENGAFGGHGMNCERIREG